MEITKQTTVEQAIQLAPDCTCQACETGCKFGSGLLAHGDEKKLAGFLNISEDKLKAEYLEEIELFNKTMHRPKVQRKSKDKPYGKCIFFDEKKKCTVHEAKPLQCRTAMPCKPYGEKLSIWFTLNYIIDPDDPESIRQWATYLKTHPTITGGELKDIVPDQERLQKILRYEILK